jgi:hypothetical protein
MLQRATRRSSWRMGLRPRATYTRSLAAPIRALLAAMAVVVTALACVALPSSRNAKPSEAATPAAAASPPTAATATAEAIEPEPTPDSWKRYLLDQSRFSAMFPASPKATEMGQHVRYEAHSPGGALYMVDCSPSAEDHGQVTRARASTHRLGRVISDGDPYFFGTEAYLSHVRLPDESERVILYVDYGARYCTVTAEVRNRDETAMHFIESFHAEPETR